METTTRPMASLIGFDAATVGSSANRGRRSTDVDGSTFAQVYDLATYAASGSRSAARVEEHPALRAVTPVPPGPALLGIEDHLAASRLYSDLTARGSWLRVADEAGSVVMRLHDADGAAVREVSITELSRTSDDDGPEVA